MSVAPQIPASLAASGGVSNVDDVVKYLLAGADVVMTASALLRHGVGHMATLLAGLTRWLDQHGVAAIGDLRGRMSQRQIDDPTAFDRANYIGILLGSAAPGDRTAG